MKVIGALHRVSKSALMMIAALLDMLDREWQPSKSRSLAEVLEVERVQQRQ